MLLGSSVVAVAMKLLRPVVSRLAVCKAEQVLWRSNSNPYVHGLERVRSRVRSQNACKDKEGAKAASLVIISMLERERKRAPPHQGNNRFMRNPPQIPLGRSRQCKGQICFDYGVQGLHYLTSPVEMISSQSSRLGTTRSRKLHKSLKTGPVREWPTPSYSLTSKESLLTPKSSRCLSVKFQIRFGIC